MKLKGIFPGYGKQFGVSLRRLRSYCATFRTPPQNQHDRRRPLDLSTLEPRILLSASPIAVDATGGFAGGDIDPTAVATPTDIELPDSAIGDTVSGDGDVQIAFVDESAQDFQLLVDDLLQQGEFDVFTINSLASGIEQIRDVLSNYQDVSSIHVVSHGNQAGIQLGNDWLDQDTLEQRTGDIASWNNTLKDGGDLLLYGCNLASSSTGQELIRSLSQLCNCDVAASNDTTGHFALGGDWDLEYEQGNVTDRVAFSPELQASWLSTLDMVTVTTTDDGIDAPDLSSISALELDPGLDGVISLREAVIAANTGTNTVQVPAGVYNFTLTGTGEDAAVTGDLDITGDVQITGAGAASTVISAQGIDRVFHFLSGNSQLQNLTITAGGMVEGAGYKVESGAFVTVTDVIVTGNSTTLDGAGIHNAGTTTLTDVTLTGNTTAADGGGIYNTNFLSIRRTTIDSNTANKGAGIFTEGSPATLSWSNLTISGNAAAVHGGGLHTDTNIELYNVTIAENNAGVMGGGVFVSGSTATVSLYNTLLADNMTGVTNENFTSTGPATSLGFNIDTDGTAGLTGTGDLNGTLLTPLDAGIQTLQNNGGAVATHALAATSPALNAGGNSPASPSTDARGQSRDEIPDIGAFESTLTAGKLYFTDSLTDEIVRVNPTGAAARQAVVTGQSDPRGLTIDMTRGYIYWVSSGDDTLKRANLDGTNVTQIMFPMLDEPRGIDLDESANILYIVNQGNNDIIEADLNASSQTVLIADTGSNATGVAVDPTNNKIYWAQANTFDGSIRSANLSDGLNVQTVEATSQLPTALALDAVNGHVYWTETQLFAADRVQRANADGTGGAVTIYSQFGTLPVGIALDVANQRIYWGDQNFDDVRAIDYDSTDFSSLSGAPTIEDVEFITLSTPPPNAPPTLTSFAAPIDSTNEDTQVELTFADFAAQGNEADSDGTVTAFIVQSVASGSLKIGTSEPAATPFVTGINDRIDVSLKAYWTPPQDQNGTLAVVSVLAEDNDGDRSASPAVLAQVNVTAINDRPILANIAGDSMTYIEGAGAQIVEQGGDAIVSDVDSLDFNGGNLTVAIAAGNFPAEDVLSIRNEGLMPGQIGFGSGNVSYGGNIFGTVSGGANGIDLLINFTTSDATQAAVRDLIKNITFANTNNDNPGVGVRTIRFTVDDGDGDNSLAHDASLTVQGQNDPPQITSPDSLTAAENQTTVDTITASDPEMNPLTWSISGGADAGRFVINSSTGLLQFAAAPNFENPTDANVDNVYEVEVRATDGLAEDKKLFSVAVTDVNDSPVANSDSYTVEQNSILSVAAPGVLGNDADEDMDTLTVSLTAPPVNGIVVLQPDGSFNYTPNMGFQGTDSFTYQLTDGSTATSSVVTIVVTTAAAPPPLPSPPPSPVPEIPEEPEDSVEDEEVSDETLPSNPPPEPVLGAPERDVAGVADNIDQRFEFRETGSLIRSVAQATSTIFAQPILESASEIRIRRVEQETYDDTSAGQAIDVSYVAESGFLWNELDHVREDLTSQVELQDLVVGGTATVTTTLTVGYVVWLLRGGQLLTSLLAQMPAWRFMQLDALAILNETGTGDPDDDDDDSVESLVEKARRDDEEVKQYEDESGVADGSKV